MAPGDYIRLSVSDTGSGMTDEVKASIFEPFFSTKESGRGTGLGLASIYGFAHQSGGDVHVYSEVDHGTVIHVYLPRYTESSVSASVVQPVEIQPTQENARVLVVEDNDMVRKVTVKRLRALGYDTIQASNGPKAVQMLKNDSSVDLVLSDIVMDGGMSGYDVAQWVKSNLPQCKILLTSGFNEQMAEASNDISENLRVLQKPYNLAELQQAVNDALVINQADI
jgi:CheY-like chemotaxis protein